MKKADLISGMVLAVFGLLMRAFVIPMQIEQAPAGYVSPRLVPNLAMIVIVMMLFKGFLHAQLGAQSYQDRIEALAAGTVIEQAGAWVLQVDPVTQKIAEVMPVSR